MFLFRAGHDKELIFFTQADVFAIDYTDEGKDREILYTFKEPMADIPKFGVFNAEQTCFVVTSKEAVWFVNTTTKKQVDLGHREEVTDIENVTVSTKNDEFFVLANKSAGKLGYYLFRVKIDDPEATRTEGRAEYLIRWENKLEIANVDIQIQQDQDENGTPETNVVVSYKCIGINTFNVFVFCLKTKLIKFWHESFQLWESPVKGFLLPSNDFLIISS